MSVEGETSYDGLELLSADFVDHFDEVLEDLVRRCPVARTAEGWLLTDHADVHATATNWQGFSSALRGISPWRPPHKHNFKPIEADPPVQNAFRRPFLRLFSPAAMQRVEPSIRAVAQDLVAEFVRAGGGDVSADFARPLVGIVFFREILGRSDDESAVFMDLVHEMVNGPVASAPAAYDRFIDGVDAMLQAEQNGGASNEFLSTILALELDGEPVSAADRTACLANFIVGGLDTTVFSITAALKHLAEHPVDRGRLVDQPSLIPVAVEEILRLFPPAWMIGRTATADQSIGGRDIASGDFVILCYAGANRDPKVFDNPTTFDLDRESHPHLAFGVGLHRCIGAPLARLEIAIAVEEFLAGAPTFLPRPETSARYTTTMVHGVESFFVDVC